MIKRFQSLTLLFIITVLSVTAQDKPAQPEKTAEQVYKNIQVLKGMPASQLDANMAFITGSLGVRCNHCHVNPFDKDEKPAKQTARRMMQMVFELNKGNFGGQSAVSCFTCHRGQPRPVSVPALGLNLWQPATAAAAKPEAPLPSVEQILDAYVQAVGGRQAIEKVTSRVLKGSRVGADGVLVPEEVYAKAPNKLLVITTYPRFASRIGFDGARGWAQSNQGVRDLGPEMLAQLKLEAEFYKETRLKELYSKMSVLGKGSVGEREAYVVEATPAAGGPAEKLYFDSQTGLLLRKYSESKIVLGQSPTQTDYEDYREVDGVKLPFQIRWAIPGRTWGRKITEVKQNLPLDDAQFNPPAGGK
ncbi:MAG TPA: c-type cytochrome [Pyrinomonadaceae bacterium]|jgi:outer membrane lipoprotein-sorting protein